MLYIYTENFFFTARAKNFAKQVLGKAARGPQAVENSLLRGLKELGVEFCVNKKPSPKAGTVAVLSGVRSLAWAIKQKRAGKIEKIIAGPNIALTPNHAKGMLAWPEVDACLVPSEQVKTAYERYNPALPGRVFVWYTGVDETFWQPKKPRPAKNKCLLYWKNGSRELIAQAEAKFKQRGFAVNIIKYGAYGRQEYKEALDESLLAVFFSQSESQGIALAEAWAMDVPTLVWDPKKPHPHLSGMVDSPAPYLSAQTGEFWQNLYELEKIIGNLDSLLPRFHPRDWLLKNMTDRVCAELFLGIAGLPKPA